MRGVLDYELPNVYKMNTEYIWGSILDGFGAGIWKVFGAYLEGVGGYLGISGGGVPQMAM